LHILWKHSTWVYEDESCEKSKRNKHNLDTMKNICHGFE